MIGQCNFIVVYAYNYIHILLLNVSYSYMIIENFIEIYIHIYFLLGTLLLIRNPCIMYILTLLLRYHCSPPYFIHFILIICVIVLSK